MTRISFTWERWASMAMERPGVQVPEGYLPVVVQTDNGPQEIEILYPADPGSIYHMTKTQDALFFHYYNKNYGIRITDLHQGIVWGTQTKETRLVPRHRGFDFLILV